MSEYMADAATNEPNAEILRAYATWAKSGAAMLLTGNIQVTREVRYSVLFFSVSDFHTFSFEVFGVSHERGGHKERHKRLQYATAQEMGRRCETRR